MTNQKKFRFEEITPQQLRPLQDLLFERNKTSHAYVEWKYGEHSPKGYRGVMVFKEETPVGCFGIVPKTLHVGKEDIRCGWFADWYVTPSARGNGLSVQLLREIMYDHYEILFGHPGPKQASATCLKRGWKPIPFQSSRRYIPSPVSFFQKRTHYSIKKILLLARYQLEIQKSALWFPKEIRANQRAPYFNEDVTWMRGQPARPNVTRIYETWQGSRAVIQYCDDDFQSGEIRRRVLFIENLYDSSELNSFFLFSKNSKVDYVDIFTTRKSIDAMLQKAGAVQFHESPVIWYSARHNIKDISIQGIDRENWLYLAADA